MQTYDLPDALKKLTALIDACAHSESTLIGKLVFQHEDGTPVTREEIDDLLPMLKTYTVPTASGTDEIDPADSASETQDLDA